MMSLLKSYVDPLSLREKLLNALAAACAIFALGFLLELMPQEDFVVPLMASMGASAFLLFVVPHSPMAQPWPLVGGHVLSGCIALAAADLIDHEIAATACGLGASVLAMQLLRCLHPPAAATALAVALSDASFGDGALHVLGYGVAGGAVTLLLVALAINNLLLHRRYPTRHTHHPHHAQFQAAHAADPLRLEEEDIAWALSQMDGIVDANQEDLMDIYELSLERALARAGENGRPHKTNRNRAA